MPKILPKTGLLLLLAFLLLSILLVFQYVDRERQRDLHHWQARLGMLADLRKAGVEKVLQEKRQALRELCSNPTLKLYLSGYGDDTPLNDDILRAQAGHVRNLLAASATRLGIQSEQRGNVNTGQPEAGTGLAVVDANARLLLATRGFPESLDTVRQAVMQTLAKGKMTLVDMYQGDQGQPIFGFASPVFPVQQLNNSKPAGVIVLLLNADSQLWPQLKNLYVDTHSDESILLRKNRHSLEYISPLKNGQEAFHQMPLSNDQLAAVFALDKPGDFAILHDYHNVNVLVTGRRVHQTPWVLMQKIDASEALAESNQNQKFLITTFSLITLLLSMLFIAVWRHSTSVRLQRIGQALESQATLLNAVTDNINEHIFLLDRNNHFVFANLSLINCLNSNRDEIEAKHLASVLGPDVADTLISLECDRDTGSLPCMVNLTLCDRSRTYHVSTIQLHQGDYAGARLYVLHDITELQQAQEKQNRLAQGIIATLVKAVDLHDPHCEKHSERTREVSLEIARQLGIRRQQCEALEMAALLANIGKLFIPKEILLKMEPLTDEENNILKGHIHHAVEILRELDFEGPVIQIISQKNEYLDGSGYPEGLKGDEILMESRILAVANAFVAMVSSRAYRPGRDVEEVLNLLLEHTGSHYDRHVVAALFHVAENKLDWKRWQTVRQ